MPWLAILRAVLVLANGIAAIIREKQLMDAGEARGVAKVLLKIAENVGVMSEIREETAKMSDEDLIKDSMET